MPELPGREAFHGTVLHSNEVRDGTFAGRRVVVVGGGKSALDLATRAAHEAASATLVQRKVNWMIPERFVLGTVGYKWILFTRRPASGREVTADVVVFATGHHRVFPFLDLPVHDRDGRLRLYRGIVPPGVDRLGFVGFRQVFNNPMGMELTAHWLVRHFLGTLRVAPDEREMRRAVEARLDWQERVLPGSGGYDFGAYDIHCADELMHDMGLPSERARNALAEYLLPGGVAGRYRNLASPDRLE
ncbi:hypothetical protein LZG04_21625 [Saccharothrix sp. S26]|uniref:hypothetical protein n=1 Tax=Saccharothrix sp. S26 TaxID=2907215 RepID=UPI001F3A8CD9|nr:hypothetical protein [Saccharothrix sp. S26]MCE6997381.1 hypothetical protein [Saccharothrix sp. S26]